MANAARRMILISLGVNALCPRERFFRGTDTRTVLNGFCATYLRFSAQAQTVRAAFTQTSLTVAALRSLVISLSAHSCASSGVIDAALRFVKSASNCRRT